MLKFLFDQLVASFNGGCPKEALLYVLSEMHKNDGLLEILEIVQDFEADEDVLFQKLFLDRIKQVDIMFNYIDDSFRLCGSSRAVIRRVLSLKMYEFPRVECRGISTQKCF